MRQLLILEAAPKLQRRNVYDGLEASARKEGARAIDSKAHENQTAGLGRLASLWMQAQPVVGAFIHGMVADRHDVEDLVQRVAETCARKFGEFDVQGDPRSFRSWALTIARFETLQYYREHYRKQKRTVGFNLEVLEMIAAEFEHREDVPDDRLGALQSCLEGVAERDRQLIEMRYYRGLQADDIADRLGLSSGAVRVALFRTRQALAKCIRRKLTVGGAS